MQEIARLADYVVTGWGDVTFPKLCGEILNGPKPLMKVHAGVQPPMASWGRMLAEGRSYISTAWWLTAFPGLAIILIVLGVNLLGDWMRDYFDPRLKTVR